MMQADKTFALLTQPVIFDPLRNVKMKQAKYSRLYNTKTYVDKSKMFSNEQNSQKRLLQSEMINFTPTTAAKKCSDLASGRPHQKILGGPNQAFGKKLVNFHKSFVVATHYIL